MRPLLGEASGALASVSTSMLMNVSCWLLRGAACDEKNVSLDHSVAHKAQHPRQACTHYAYYKA